jgi:hypothetical protein
MNLCFCEHFNRRFVFKTFRLPQYSIKPPYIVSMHSRLCLMQRSDVSVKARYRRWLCAFDRQSFPIRIVFNRDKSLFNLFVIFVPSNYLYHSDEVALGDGFIADNVINHSFAFTCMLM